MPRIFLTPRILKGHLPQDVTPASCPLCRRWAPPLVTSHVNLPLALSMCRSFSFYSPNCKSGFVNALIDLAACACSQCYTHTYSPPHAKSSFNELLAPFHHSLSLCVSLSVSLSLSLSLSVCLSLSLALSLLRIDHRSFLPRMCCYLPRSIVTPEARVLSP